MKLYDNDAYRDQFMEVVYSLLFSDGTNDRANQIIDAFDSIPAVNTAAEPFDGGPLTLEEVQQMSGEPIWTVFLGEKDSGQWELCTCETITTCPLHKVLFCVSAKGETTDCEFDSYGRTWLAYRRKLEGPAGSAGGANAGPAAEVETERLRRKQEEI